jgi:SAM-dependent methyltransferase
VTMPLVRPMRLAARAGSGLIESVWRAASALAQDRWYGIDTYASAIDRGQQTHADASPYEPLGYAALRTILREVTLREDDVFFDIGCGKGRVLCLFARRNLKKCVGIEYLPDLAAAALTNSRRARNLRTPIEIRVEDAAITDYSEATLVLFYNPFGVERMRRCLAQIRESVSAHPRPMRIIYANPIAAQAFHDCADWLRAVKSFHVPYLRRRDPSTVSLWEVR